MIRIGKPERVDAGANDGASRVEVDDMTLDSKRFAVRLLENLRMISGKKS